MRRATPIRSSAARFSGAEPGRGEAGEHAQLEPRRVTARRRVLVARDPRQLGKARVTGLSIEAVTVPPRDGRHAETEATDDDGRRGIAAQIAGRPVESIVDAGEAGSISRPETAKDLRRLGNALSANGVGLDGEAQPLLLSRIRRARAAPRAQAQDETAAGDLLERGRHVREEARVPARHVE